MLMVFALWSAKAQRPTAMLTRPSRQVRPESRHKKQVCDALSRVYVFAEQLSQVLPVEKRPGPHATHPSELVSGSKPAEQLANVHAV